MEFFKRIMGRNKKATTPQIDEDEVTIAQDGDATHYTVVPKKSKKPLLAVESATHRARRITKRKAQATARQIQYRKARGLRKVA